MHGSLGHFKATLQRRKERKAKTEGRFDKKKLKYDGSRVETEFNFPTLSKSKMDKLKKNIRTNIKRNRIKDYILFSATLLIIFVLVYYFVNL